MSDRNNHQSVQHSTLLERGCIVVEVAGMLVEYKTFSISYALSK